jgi:hypothetical protein
MLIYLTIVIYKSSEIQIIREEIHTIFNEYNLIYFLSTDFFECIFYIIILIHQIFIQS